MVEPVGFVEAWKAQFPDSDPPHMELNSVGDIEQELEKCKASIRRLEMEVNKERFRMIYLQTFLAKERKSYDRQRWGFRRVSQMQEGDQPAGAEPQQPHGQEPGERDRDRGKIRPRPPPPRKSSSHNIECPEPPLAPEVHQGEVGETDQCRYYGESEVDGLSPSKHKGGSSSRRPTAAQVTVDKDVPSDTSAMEKMGMGLGVAALRSNFERIKRANSHSSAEGKMEKPFYVNMEYHNEKGLVKVNDREVSDKISNLGSQAIQMERKRSLHSLPGNLATGMSEFRKPMSRGRSQESNCGYDIDYEDTELNPRFLKDNMVRANGSKPDRHPQPHPQPWQQSDFQPYTSVFVGGMMGEGDGKGVNMRDHSGDDCRHLTWPRRSYSPGSFEDIGGGYTPDCSSNENLTSSEEDFSSGQSSHVSPSPTTYRMFREKSRSPSQNSHHSFDSSSPPTPQSQKRHKQQVVASEATIVGVRKTGQIWPNDGDSTPSSRASHDNSFHADLDVLRRPVFTRIR